MTLPTIYQQFIHTSRYARYLDREERRETWEETVERYFNFMEEHLLFKCNYKIPTTLKEELKQSVLELNSMPSMRCLMTAGPALERDHVAGYNCSYLPIDDVKSFDETMYVLLCGTGVGFSVEHNHIEKLPVVAETFSRTDSVIVVEDSKAGWAKAFRELLSMLYGGMIPKIDVSRVRAAGSRLKTFGGRASGPQPLINLFDFSIELFQKAKGRQLEALECHDLVCKIGEVVVVGGVRRSALISLSNINDDSMRKAKSGSWWVDNPQRALANNSACYKRTPDMSLFMTEWKSLYESKSGERGIFNREAAKKKVAENGRRNSEFVFGTNPCCEIILRPYQFCNLTEVIVRETDAECDLEKKVRHATILGTFQSSLTDFKYLRKVWHNNTKEECLLGVSLTGIMDNKLTLNPTNSFLERLKNVSISTNKEFAKKLGINQSTAVTCVKPSGTVSQLVDSASGIHTRHSDYYIRAVRMDNKDPLTQLLKDKGVPVEPEISKPNDVSVFSFPIKSPKGAITRHKLSAIEQLEIWLMYQRHWCEHKPSATVTVKEDEWMSVGAWVYEHFDEVAGISFLPAFDHVYQQAPYQDITEKDYKQAVKAMPANLNFKELKDYESGDNTTGSQEFSCVGNSCELVDVGV